MIYLILSIIASATMPLIMRLSVGKLKSEYGMYLMNYAISVALSLLFMNEFKPLASIEGIDRVLIVSIISGISYPITFYYYNQSIAKAGMVLTSIFKKAGMIVPILIAVVFFKETLKVNHIIGILLSLVAILLINYQKNSFSKIEHLDVLVLCMLVGGLTDAMKDIFNQVADSSLTDYYLLISFLVAFTIIAIIVLRRKEKIGKNEIIYGILIGIPNYFGARFFTMSLVTIPAVIAYPAYFMLSMLAMTIAGVFIFKEKMTLNKAIALILVIVSMIVLNI